MRYYSLNEAAKLLGLKNGNVLRDYINKGYVKAQKIGSQWVVTNAQILQRLRNVRKKKVEGIL